MAAAIVLLSGAGTAVAQTVYATDFDALTTGVTQLYPGAAGQGGWFSELAVSPAYGEIESTVAVSGNALHEFTGIGNDSGQQTIDRLILEPFYVDPSPYIRLRVDFFAKTSNLLAQNNYFASLVAAGGPHPGFVITQISLESGNGQVKQDDGVDVVVAYFNGVDNHGPIPLTVGQDLSWESWHSVELVGDRTTGYWVYVNVDGQAQDIRSYLLPRGNDDGSWELGLQIDEIKAQVIPTDSFSFETDDDVYWDNLELTAGLFLDGFELGDETTWSSSSG